MSETEPRRRGPGRPKTTGETTSRSIRSGQVWDDLAAHYAPETMSTVVNRLLEQEAARLRETGQLD